MSLTTTRTKSSSAGPVGLALLLIYAVAINVAATQYLASRFGHDPSLGRPIAGSFYAPWAWVEWMMRFYRNQPKLFGTVEISVIVALGVGLLGYVFAIGFGTRSSRKNEGVYGTAHWAKDENEVRATGLLPEPGQPGAGVYVGGWTDKHGRLRYLRHDGPEHVAAIAPTRSGKGVGLVNTTLLSWPHSVVVNDQKGELWHLTSGWRQKHANNKVLKFDPASAGEGISFNPLEECRVGTPYEVADVQNTVTIMVDPDGKGLADHWAKTSHALLTGLVLHLQYIAMKEGKNATLPGVAFALSDPARPVEALYSEMLENTHLDGKPHPVVAAAARDMLNRPDEERGSVLSSAMSYLALYRDPLVAANVSRSDFKIMELMNSETPVSLYLIVRAEDKDRLKPLMRLIINQLVRVLLRPELKYENGRPVRPHKHRLLMMLDEFPSYGKLEVFQEALAYIAGYGIKAYLIMQDIAQLWSAYGRDETVISNCHIRVAYAPNKIETGEWLSKNCGTTTIVKEDISTSGQRFGAFLQNVNRAFHEVSRPLLTPDEAMRLKAPKKNGGDEITEPGEVIVLTAGHAPIKGTQSLYFRDPVFLERAKIGPAKTDRLTRASAAPSKPASPPKEFKL